MTLHATTPSHEHQGWWWKTLTGGAILWILTAVVTLQTGNTNLVPTVILLGSFLVPFTVVLFVAERVQGNLDPVGLMVAFFVGGIMGVLGASLLEVNLESTWYIYIGVGFCEELVKGIVLFVIGSRVIPKNGYQGALLGATVGAGFAAFESAGYAFNAGLTRRGIDLISMMETEAIRSILTPVGHVLWTAILGAAIFGAAAKAAPAGKLAVDYAFRWSIVGAFAIIVGLHALWDSMGYLSALIALVLTGGVMDVLQYGQLPPAQAYSVQHMSTMIYIAGLVIISAIGIAVLKKFAVKPAVGAPGAVHGQVPGHPIPGHAVGDQVPGQQGHRGGPGAAGGAGGPGGPGAPGHH